MQARRDLSSAQINEHLLGFVLHTPRWFWIVVLLLAVPIGGVLVGILLIILFGLQVLGYTNTVLWSVLIANFIFWVGMSQAGVIISAVLHLTRAEWRRPITRAAEILAISTLVAASLFPFIHTGRMWRTMYWFLPYDFARDIWPNIRSALIWDPSAIIVYLVGTILLVYVDLIPDLAVARDRSTRWHRAIYGALALGFRGTTRQWQLQLKGGQLLSALILPVFVLEYSIAAWDLSMNILPGWHSTVLAPYFVIGAAHSGLAAVVTTMAALRWVFQLKDYITLEHFDVVGRLQIVVALTYLFFFSLYFLYGLFSADPVEVRIWELRLFTPPMSLLFYVQVLTVLVLPFPLLLFRALRRSVLAMFAISLLVNVGMFLERYILVVTPLLFKQPWVFMWDTFYWPTLVEYAITAGTVAIVIAGLLVFAKLFPIVPIWDVKEGQVLKTRVRIGRASVPAVRREE